MEEGATVVTRARVKELGLPPLRFWLALVLLAAEIVFLEKAAKITSGGVSAVALPFAHWLNLRVGTVMLLIKGLILLAVLRWSGRRIALWTAVASLVSSALIWLLEGIPWQPHWSPWVAMPVLLSLSGTSISLLWNAGYSSGGYAALAQVLRLRRGIPVGLSMFVMNCLSLAFMYLAFGVLSGTLSVVTTLVYGPMSGVWLHIWGRLLPPVPGAVPAGAGAPE